MNVLVIGVTSGDLGRCDAGWAGRSQPQAKGPNNFTFLLERLYISIDSMREGLRVMFGPRNVYQRSRISISCMM